jgi:hypothetical protein
MSAAEIRFSVVDYFDSSDDANAPYFQYNINSTASIVSNGTANPLDGLVPFVRRFIGADIWALPKFDLDTSGSAHMVLTTVPTATGTDESAPGTSSNVQSTMVIPRTDSRWVKVGSWRAKKLFADTTILPAQNPSGDVAIFAGVVLNPDSLLPSGIRMQFKIKVYFSETVPAISQMKVFESNLVNSTSLYAVETTAATSRSVQLCADGITHNT